MQVAQVQVSVVSDGVLQLYKPDLIQSIEYRTFASLAQHYDLNGYHEVKSQFAYQSDAAYTLFSKRTTHRSCSEELVPGEQLDLSAFSATRIYVKFLPVPSLLRNFE